jgi:hypothetical protein
MGSSVCRHCSEQAALRDFKVPLRVSRRYRWYAGVHIGHAMPTGAGCTAFACSGTARTAYAHRRPRAGWPGRAGHVAAPRALGAGWGRAAARLQPERR